MIENEFFNEVKKRKVEYQQKLNDVTPPELEGIGEELIFNLELLLNVYSLGLTVITIKVF